MPVSDPCIARSPFSSVVGADDQTVVEYLRSHGHQLSMRELGKRTGRSTVWIRSALRSLEVSPQPANWSKPLLIQRLRLMQAHGLEMRSCDVYRGYSGVHRAACRLFGSWNAALGAADLPLAPSPHNAPRWTKERLVTAVLQRHRDGECLRQSVAQREASALVQAAQRLFGSWRRAIEAAGLTFEEVALLDRRGRPSRPKGYWTPETVVWQIRQRAALGQSLRISDMQLDEGGLVTAARRHFTDGWSAAVEAAGFDYDEIRSGTRWTSDLVLTMLRELSAAGATLTAGALALAGHVMLVSHAQQYFGSVGAALIAAGIELPGHAASTRPEVPKDLTMTIYSECLRSALLDRGWSQAELSRRTGLDAGHISRYANGKLHPQRRNFLKILDALGMTEQEFMSGEARQPDEAQLHLLCEIEVLLGLARRLIDSHRKQHVPDESVDPERLMMDATLEALDRKVGEVREMIRPRRLHSSHQESSQPVPTASEEAVTPRA